MERHAPAQVGQLAKVLSAVSQTASDALLLYYFPLIPHIPPT